MKKGQIWISAALYTALGVVLVTLILSVGMPFVNKIKARNTLLQTKNVMYDMDEVIRSVYNEGFGSKRPLFIDIGEGDFEIDSVNEKIKWSMFSEEILGIEPGTEEEPIVIKEGNLNIKSTELGQGYQIELYLDYEGWIDIKSELKMVSGKYNLVVSHKIENENDFVEITG